MPEELTVLSVLWGDKYDKAYAYALQEMVSKNLTVPHTFKCVTTQPLPGIETVKPWVSYQGWWQKIGLFAPMIATGPTLYFDLDVVITGSLDYLVPYTESYPLAAPANWAQSGHGGIQSSVMAWNGKYHEPYKTFDWARDSARLWGDQEYLTELLGGDWVKLPGVGSYKYHVRPTGGIPEDMSVCCFHGKPDPHEVTDVCLSPYISTRLSSIK